MLEQHDMVNYLNEIIGIEQASFPICLVYTSPAFHGDLSCQINFSYKNDQLEIEAAIPTPNNLAISASILEANCGWADASLSWMYFCQEAQSAALKTVCDPKLLTPDQLSLRVASFILACEKMRAVLDEA